MKLYDFEEYLVNFIASPDVPPWVHEVCGNIEGMCEPETLAILNHVNSHYLEGDEQYLEIGTWKGRTAIAALLHSGAPNTVIDPLTYDDSSTVFYQNLQKYELKDRVNFYQDTWENVLDNYKTSSPIGVHFFDGDHGDLSTFMAWEKWLPHCSDECLLIADDLLMEPVQRDVDLFRGKYTDNILFIHEAPFGMHQSFIGFKR